LHSAGVYPVRFERVLPLVDWVGLDIKVLAEDYEALTGVPGAGDSAWKCAHMLITYGVPHQIRTTRHPLNTEPEKQRLLIERLKALGGTHHVWQTCHQNHRFKQSCLIETQ
jgi:pyruvate formate lyase activating enzyme